MSESNRATALAFADVFDEVNGSLENLEGLSSTANNPVIFHVLRVYEQLKGKAQDSSLVKKYENEHSKLNGKINDSYSEVMSIIKDYADRENDNAKLILAEALMFGWGVAQDAGRAEKIFEELAAKGNTYAVNLLVQSHFASQKYRLSKQKLEELYQTGMNYYFGRDGVRMSNAKAAEYFTQAANGGHAGAQYMLGACYRLGYGVNRDLQKARYWYEKAAAQGNLGAINALDNMNRRGE